ncbi:hypothetical protein Lsai_2394 [Legionella sainthelensi]|uniref:Uncharacterized protein n=1 Tax=Legionella sainthelensi TaxID=28087 RepID=A0A0W0YDF1_9GAMM|nr:hypothetical protein [Legionella sainthelensi]KTD54802.1 hypothetical protein Lsai_2394 [Legionella sainthelensi]VEH36839.1 Uncharacterised protein [Legionella sainthelensi]
MHFCSFDCGDNLYLDENNTIQKELQRLGNKYIVLDPLFGVVATGDKYLQEAEIAKFFALSKLDRINKARDILFKKNNTTVEQETANILESVKQELR